MTLSELQQHFAQEAALLIQQAQMMGYAVTLSEAYRTPQQAAADQAAGTGISNSLHTERLAIDLNVFVNGAYQLDNSSGCYSALGSWWKSRGPDHYWGGDFHMVDLDHFSISPDGGATR